MAEDPILMARLDALKRNLIQVENSSTWLRDGTIGRDTIKHEGVAIENWRDDLWTELDVTIGKRARRLRVGLEEVHNKLKRSAGKTDEDAAQDLTEAWQLYSFIQNQCEEVFEECLEFIGGLAFRDRGFDRRICQVADELIRTCAFDSNVTWMSLTVLTLQVRLGQTLARIIRLRFPEWTIWTLSFTAHEFAYVVIKSTTLHLLVQEYVKKFAAQSADLKRLLADETLDYNAKKLAEELCKQRIEGYIQKLVADAFATYTMGPAYALAALLLRFNPSTESISEESNHPTDIKRAEVVLSVLKRMNDEAIKPKPYDDVIEYLEKEWKAVLSRTATRNASTMQPMTATQSIATSTGNNWLENLIDVEKLVEHLFREFSLELRTSALYPPKGDNGWLKAQEWADQFQKYTQNTSGDALSAFIKITRASKLRDALNAAWLNRVFNDPQSLNLITDAALQLCSAIINKSWDDNPPPPPSAADRMVSSSSGPALPQKSFSKSQS